MSGPKDFQIIISIARQAEIAARSEERRKRSQRAIQERIAANQERIAEELRRAAEVRRIELARVTSQTLAQLSRDDRNAKHREEKEVSSASSVTDSRKPSEEIDQANNLAANTVSAANAVIDDYETRIFKLTEELLTQRMLLQTNVTVRDFESERLDLWLKDASAHLDSISEDGDAWIERANAIQSEGEAVLQSANSKEEKFNLRNEILSDVIAALKEIGFVVRDPEFEDSTRPDKRVFLHALRGAETFEAKIDLEQQVESIWNRISKEHCQDSFVEFVQSLGTKGVDVKADWLADVNPKRIEKGSKLLPTSRPETERNS